MQVRTMLGVVLVPALLLGGVAAASAAEPGTSCAVNKRKAAVKKVAASLKCVGAAAATGMAVKPECLAKAETKLDAAFAKADALGTCLSTTDLAATRTATDTCVTDLRAALAVTASTPPVSRCAAGKLGAAAKKTTARLTCFNKSLTAVQLVSADCLALAQQKLEAAFGKAENKGDCLTMADAAGVGTAVDTCVNAIRGAVTAPPELSCNAEPGVFSGITAQHNSVRAGASPTPNPPLVPLCWSDLVAGHAQAWADTCSFAHDPALGTFKEGQNIYATAVSSGFSPTAAQDAVPGFAAEAAFYNYATNTCAPGEVCGHYTQIVWRATNVVGCGIKNCTVNSPFDGFPNPNWTIVVCNYKPPGNFRGKRPY